MYESSLIHVFHYLSEGLPILEIRHSKELKHLSKPNQISFEYLQLLPPDVLLALVNVPFLLCIIIFFRLVRSIVDWHSSSCHYPS